MDFLIDNKKVFSTDTGAEFDSKKHSILLLHGSGQSHVVWSLTAQYLSDQNYNVFALDFPGHGNSEGESLTSIEDMAIWLKKVPKKYHWSLKTVFDLPEYGGTEIPISSKYGIR